MSKAKELFRDESGVTTVGMAVALLVSLALVFTSAQVYRVNSAAAEIQEVADAAALAAEGEVSKFMVAVRVCDATVLSLSLLAISAYGLGVVAMCVPAAEGFSVKLLEFGQRAFEARDAFAQKAARGLNSVQRALPFLAAASAARVAAANNETGSLQASYYAAAVLIPSSGETIEVGGSDAARELEREVGEKAESLKEAARQAEQAALEASEAKARGFASDCGAYPSYCLYERAQRLVGLGDAANPLYSSVDAWSFSVALKRAQAYYAKRSQTEGPRVGDSVSAQANAVMRKRFYAYAEEQLARGYVRESQGSFACNFPHLFRNVDELKSTELYREAVYPITPQGDALAMHAWSGCPSAAGSTNVGSLADLDGGGFETCPLCEFGVSSLGNVAAASTSIDNGFEFHYEAVARAARDYEAARARLDPKAAEVRESAGGLFDRCAELMKQFGSSRIKASPPGSKGAIAMVVNERSVAADAGFESRFVAGGQTLGARAAVSGATLVEDSSDDESTVITSLLDGLGGDAGAAVGAARVMLDCWSGMLRVFSDGQEALSGGIERALGSLPLASGSGLGKWAGDALRSGLAALGLEPVSLYALKPALINTAHVVSGDDGSFSVAYREAQQGALALSSPSGGLFSSLVDGIEARASDGLELAGEGVLVAVIDFPIGGASIPLKLAIPPSLVQHAQGFVGECVAALRSVVGSVTGERAWV